MTLGSSRSLKSALSAGLVLGSLLMSAPDAVAQNNGQSKKVPASFSVVPIDITSVVVENGQLVARGLVGTNPFTSVVSLAARPAPVALDAPTALAACPILDLSLGPIDLNLLGLRVETSPICLEVTAYDGGGLLGDLLCSVANLLQGGMPLADVLALVQSQGNLPRLLNGITTLLNGALDAVTSNVIASQPTGAIAASCSVLDLSLGPIELNLLGLEVILDDCNDGPVTVTITAIPGGGLLGDLLCGLTGGALNGPSTALQRLLFQISAILGGILS
jgi:hypothetical protein